MKWIVNDIRNGWAQLQRWQTWLGLGLIALFAGLAYLLTSFAFRTDALLVYLHRSGSACREMTNGTIISMFCGMIFFLFFALLTLGEFQRYFEYSHRNAHHQARQALRGGIAWGLGTVTLAMVALVFFTQYCR